MEYCVNPKNGHIAIHCVHCGKPIELPLTEKELLSWNPTIRMKFKTLLIKPSLIDEGKAEMDYCFTKMMNGEKVSPTWSAEDENCLSTIIAEFSKCAGKSVSKDDWMRCNDFLNSLKDRVCPKQEWTEEDESTP